MPQPEWGLHKPAMDQLVDRLASDRGRTSSCPGDQLSDSEEVREAVLQASWEGEKDLDCSRTRGRHENERREGHHWGS